MGMIFTVKHLPITKIDQLSVIRGDHDLSILQKMDSSKFCCQFDTPIKLAYPLVHYKCYTEEVHAKQSPVHW